MMRLDKFWAVSFLGIPTAALLLTVIQPPIGWHLLAWVAWVPFVLSCASPALSQRQLALTAYATSVLYWLINIHWIAPVTPPGWIALCLFLGWTWPAVALTLRFALRRGLPLWLVCAVVVTGTERIQGCPLEDFFWRMLAHSQYTNIRCIQIADTLGAAGLSFVIAAINGLIAGLCLPHPDRRLRKRRRIAHLCFAAGILVGLLGYGEWRIRQSATSIEAGPLVAAIQSNVPQSVKDSESKADIILADLLRMSEAAVQAGAELIVWPETMVPVILDESFQSLLERREQWHEVYQKLSTLTRNQTHLVVGAYGATLTIDAKGRRQLARHNSVYFFDRSGSLDPARYDKMNLLVFGEYMPFRESWPWLFNLLLKCSPYDYDYSLTPGKAPQRFTMVGTRAPYTFGPLICYEDTLPGIARQFLSGGNRGKSVDWLVSVSNDGWFVGFNDSRVRPSGELSQHLAACVFRAVENRVSILRSVNTGISGLIDSNGRLRNDYLSASPGLPKRVVERQGIPGWFVDRMPIDRRIGPYTKLGPWLENGCALGFALLAGMALIQPLIGNRKQQLSTAKGNT